VVVDQFESSIDRIETPATEEMSEG
jgi:hypothetical protein